MRTPYVSPPFINYQEGTYTPTLTFGGGATGMTFGSRQGWWTRIGRGIAISGVIVLTAKGSSTGAARITLPFSCTASYGKQGGGSSPLAVNMASLTGGITFFPDPGTPTTAQVTMTGTTGVASITHANFTDTSSLYFDILYFVD